MFRFIAQKVFFYSFFFDNTLINSISCTKVPAAHVLMAQRVCPFGALAYALGLHGPRRTQTPVGGKITIKKRD